MVCWESGSGFGHKRGPDPEGPMYRYGIKKGFQRGVWILTVGSAEAYTLPVVTI